MNKLFTLVAAGGLAFSMIGCAENKPPAPAPTKEAPKMDETPAPAPTEPAPPEEKK